jgi:signal transduction histidine kinase
MKGSLRTAFTSIWLFVVATCVAVAFLMHGLYRLGVDARVDSVAARVDQAAAALQQRFAVYARSDPSRPVSVDEPRRRELRLMLEIVLAGYEDVEGGFYDRHAGFVAYAFPTYEGSATKQDVPAAEATQVAELADATLKTGVAEAHRMAGARETLILRAAPAAPGSDLAIWVMARAHVRADDGTNRLAAGLGLLAFFIVASGVALLVVLRRWNAAFERLAGDVAGVEAGRGWTPRRTGHRDIDRVAVLVAALHERLDRQRQAAHVLENELARAQRIASVGRMTAQLVHEIRNPIAAMRLRAENGLAGVGDPATALRHVLQDVHRLDDLLERMQAMTRLTALHPEPVRIDRWLAARIDAAAAAAQAREVVLDLRCPAMTWAIDPAQLARAVDNLVLNAIQHAPRGLGRVRLGAAAEPGVALRIVVMDNGPGVAPESIEQVFEPFHTTRVDGTGLGLSIAREIVEAHGGTLSVVEPDGQLDPANDDAAAFTGATFLMELPWRAS